MKKIERAKTEESEITNRQNKISELIELQIQKLANELDEKNIEFQEGLQNAQQEFFETTTEKNKEQLKTIWFAAIISAISLLVAIFK